MEIMVHIHYIQTIMDSLKSQEDKLSNTNLLFYPLITNLFTATAHEFVYQYHS